MKPTDPNGPSSPWYYQPKYLVPIGIGAVALGALAYSKIRPQPVILPEMPIPTPSPILIPEPSLAEELDCFTTALDKQFAKGPVSNELYILETPEGPVRIRILVRDQHGLKPKPQPGFSGFHGSGVAVAIDGPSIPSIQETIDQLAAKYQLRVRVTLHGPLHNGENPVDFLAEF